MHHEGDVVVGIFINTNTHPNLFRNAENIHEPNQSYFQSDHLKELLDKQQQVNDSFQKAFKDIRISFQKQQLAESKRWREVVSDIEAIKASNERHDEFERQAREWLAMLEDNSKELHRIVEQNGSINQEVMGEINRIHQSNEEIVNQLLKFETMNEQFTNKMEEMVGIQQSMSNDISLQHDKQDKVIEHIENQEAMLEKSYRQLSNLRSIIFERTSVVTDKLEESYRLTSSLFYKLFTGSDKPLTLLMNPKKENNKEG